MEFAVCKATQAANARDDGFRWRTGVVSWRNFNFAINPSIHDIQSYSTFAYEITIWGAYGGCPRCCLIYSVCPRLREICGPICTFEGTDRTDRRSWVRFQHHTLAFFRLKMTSEAKYVFIFEIYGSNYIFCITWNIVNISDKTEKRWHPWWELNPRPPVCPIGARKRANWAADFRTAWSREIVTHRVYSKGVR